MARSVLDDLVAEMARRNQTFGAHGVADLSAYRAAGQPGGPLPRLLLVIDEYQQLFEGDREGEASANLLRLSQQGRSAGIHMLLSSQRIDPGQMLHRNEIFGNVHLRMAMQLAQSDTAALTEFGPSGRRMIALTCDRAGRVVHQRSGGRRHRERERHRRPARSGPPRRAGGGARRTGPAAAPTGTTGPHHRARWCRAAGAERQPAPAGVGGPARVAHRSRARTAGPPARDRRRLRGPRLVEQRASGAAVPGPAVHRAGPGPGDVAAPHRRASVGGGRARSRRGSGCWPARWWVRRSPSVRPNCGCGSPTAAQLGTSWAAVLPHAVAELVGLGFQARHTTTADDITAVIEGIAGARPKTARPAGCATAIRRCCWC